MDTADVPRMQSVKNLHAILDAMQKAAEPKAFGVDFLKDMGFKSSRDRAIIKLLKFLGMLDASGKPQESYREFLDHTRSKKVLAGRMVSAYDDLFKSDKNAQSKTAKDLAGWFKTKTGVGLKVAEKMATTFKSISSYADFSDSKSVVEKQEEARAEASNLPPDSGDEASTTRGIGGTLGLTYRIEVHLPDTTNVDTFRSIFRAIREELI